MEESNQSQLEEEFLQAPSKVQELIDHLQGIITQNKMFDQNSNKKRVEEDTTTDINIDANNNFFISSRSRRTGRYSSRAPSRSRRASTRTAGNTNQFTFMRQIDQTEQQRLEVRKERECIAMNFRRLGNYEYRKKQYKTAINFYTKGLDYINDTPVLYCNRACCFIKLRNFERALMDCNYVLNNFDPKNLYALLYRVLAYKRLNDVRNLKESIFQVKHLCSNNMKFIDEFLEKMYTTA